MDPLFHTDLSISDSLKSVGLSAAKGSITQGAYLRVFLSIGNIPMDNNYIEQAIRPFTVGRKNFVLIELSRGANASTILYILVEAAKANNLNTFKYFNLLLTKKSKIIVE